MGRRGPKPVEIGPLATLEYEFYKAFRLLRDGTHGPSMSPGPQGLTREDLRSSIARLKRMSLEHYWLTSRRVAREMDVAVNLARPPMNVDLWWAEREKAEEIRCLEWELNPHGVEALVRRRKIWDDLIKAETYAALRKACGRWAQLSDVRRRGMTGFPKHVVQHAAQFLSMKKNERFPHSTYGDDARLEFLARGMAGVLRGVSPMTGIERLRNMKHERGGPLWITHQGDYVLPEGEQYCGCWRCSIKRSAKLTQFGRVGYENGLKLFMELSASTKVPMEWMKPDQSR